ncbi:DUF1214 domain-containing protein [Phyllobacterium phragmitis]|uniref:DUF1214 domain-containing protein n=1 Tax=Phyllobacterium phragmitis TaxID=2670329 RepID=A0ABQ0GXI3_9HYPH
MLRTVLLTGLTLAIAIGGGTGSVQYALDRFEGFGALKVGQWSAYPAAGTPDSDPYAKARGARNGTLALGAAEGLIFHASRDARGRELDRSCTYRITGATPPARFWTLYPADRSLQPLPPRPGMLPALHSREILRSEDGRFSITVSPEAQPGNWLPVEGSGPFVLVMTFYDTPVASSSGLSDLVMPSASLVEEAGCRG